MSRQHLILFGILACTSLFSLVYATREKSEAKAMAASREELSNNLASARAEIQTLASKVNALTEPAAAAPVPPPVQAAPVHAPAATAPPRRRPAAQPVARPRPTEDPRWKRVESQLADHQSQIVRQRQRIDETQEDVRKAGDQLDGKINSTRDDLNRSIASNHDDVVQLQKRGERTIYEFDLTKSKQFQRVGPLSLSLRKADTKHRRYDLSMMVDDKSVDKQGVNLLEPVWISLADRPQPVQLVVNQIDKNHVRGYISEPRYKNGELAGGTASSPVPPAALKSR
jgi:hypothetical protein